MIDEISNWFVRGDKRYNLVMSQLILIRHSISRQDASVPANQWRLSQEGREACGPLAEAMRGYGLTRLVASMEPKAIETAQLVGEQLGLPWQIAAGLQEHDRSNVPFLGSKAQFEERVIEMFQKPDELVFGRETANQALARFQVAVQALVEDYQGERLGIASHGTVISLLVGHANPIDTVDFWRRLKMPDYIVLALPDFELMEGK